ncbi:MAG: winged helix-turn-helix domain-containing protein [Pseudomonadota bacterium]|nr:winged helix-turn-helix domain-containing protein [Pseudomonadota bacterium]
MSFSVLLVEDDLDLRSTLQQALEVEGYRVYAAKSIAEATLFIRNPPGGTLDMALIDLGLPDGDGTVLLNLLRRQGPSPVLIISAQDTDRGKVSLLDAGADDYLVKPFSISELLARMRVALRHRGIARTAAQTQYQCGEVRIDLHTRRVERNGQAVHLTPTEFNLLARLVRSAGQVVTHRQLLTDVWGKDFSEHTHYLRLYMAQLRAKLESNPAAPLLLHTETGVGYRLQEAIEP